MEGFLTSAIKQFQYYKTLAENSMSQLNLEALHWKPNEASNSIVNIIQHMHGNMMSRWTDFLTSDGEKPSRNRDAEFEDLLLSQEQLMNLWNDGWQTVFTALETLSEADLNATIYIRNQGHSVIDAINRQLAHYPYHVGQIVLIAKTLAQDWKALTIPKGQSQSFNEKKFSQPKHIENFTDEYLKADSWVPRQINLESKNLIVRSLEPKDIEQLLELAQDKRIWEFYALDGSNKTTLKTSLQQSFQDKSQHAFVITLEPEGKIIGTTRFLDIQPTHRKLEIGWTWMHPNYWATGLNSECKFLLLQFCFEKLNTARIQLKTDENNIRSRKAIEKIGGQFEGILRNDMIRENGTHRNSAYFSIIPEDRLKLTQSL